MGGHWPDRGGVQGGGIKDLGLFCNVGVLRDRWPDENWMGTDDEKWWAKE